MTSDLTVFMPLFRPALPQWTASGPAGPSGVRAQQPVVRDDEAPPESSCGPASMEGSRVRAPTCAARPARPPTAVREY